MYCAALAISSLLPATNSETFGYFLGLKMMKNAEYRMGIGHCAVRPIYQHIDIDHTNSNHNWTECNALVVYSMADHAKREVRCCLVLGYDVPLNFRVCAINQMGSRFAMNRQNLRESHCKEANLSSIQPTIWEIFASNFNWNRSQRIAMKTTKVFLSLW